MTAKRYLYFVTVSVRDYDSDVLGAWFFSMFSVKNTMFKFTHKNILMTKNAPTEKKEIFSAQNSLRFVND